MSGRKQTFEEWATPAITALYKTALRDDQTGAGRPAAMPPPSGNAIRRVIDSCYMAEPSATAEDTMVALISVLKAMCDEQYKQLLELIATRPMPLVIVRVP